MRKLTRSLGLALASAGVASALALSTATGAEAANQALMVNGLAAGKLTDIAMANILGGMFGGSKYERQNVDWPQQARPVTGQDSLTLTESVTQGTTNLDTALADSLTKIGPGEHVTIVGLSAGSLVVDEELRALAANPDAPDKTQLNFVVIADSSRIGFNKNRYDGTIGYQYKVPAETKYDTTVVAAEYDGFADFPDRWWNFVAVANALAGTLVEHIPTMLTDLSTVPADNVSVSTNSLGGVTTTYLIPAAHLPLVQLAPFLAGQEAQLKQIVDSAYARNDDKGAAAAATPAPAQAVADTTVDQVAAAPEASAPEASAPEISAPEISAPAVAVKAPLVSAPAAAAEVAAVVAPPTPRADEVAATPGDTPRQVGRTTAGSRTDHAGGGRRSAAAKAAAAARDNSDKPSA